MSSFSPKLFVICVALVVGPPAALVAWHYDEWLRPKPIDPRTVVGELLVFEAPWCGACKSMKPVVSQLREEGFSIRTVNLEHNDKKAQQYGVRAIPTFVLVRDGQEVRRATGAMSAENLRQMWR